MKQAQFNLFARALAVSSALPRVSLAAVGVALVVAMSACTTTTRVTEVRPLPPKGVATNASELRIAETALDSGNVDLATNIYDRIVKDDPKSVEGTTGLGNALYSVGDFTRAGVYFQRASQLDPTSVAPMIGSARVAIHQRRFDDAIATYRQVLKLSPGNPVAYAGLGAALDLKGDHAQAQAELRNALALHPGDPILGIDLGLSLTLGGNPREGVNVLLDVTRFPSAPPQAREDLALAYGLLGNDEAATALLSQDLPKASVQDNLRYYEIQRERLGHPSAAISPSTPVVAAPVAVAPVAAPQASVAALPEHLAEPAANTNGELTK